MGRLLKVGDFVEIKDSVFSDKIGKIGRVTSVRPTWEHPYEVAVDGDHSVFTRDHLSDSVSIENIVRRLNKAVDRIAELESAQEPQEGAVPTI